MPHWLVTAAHTARALKQLLTEMFPARCVTDALLRLKRQDIAPIAHVARPFDGKDADIRTDIQNFYPVAEMGPPRVQQGHHDLCLIGVVAGFRQQSVSNPISLIRSRHAVVVSVDNHRAMIR
jgi:hypothetical protein